MPRQKLTQTVRLQDVARAAGVSAMTVSRALRGLEGLSEATRQRVLHVAQELRYVPNSNARALAVTSANLIGIALPTLFNDVFADILLSLQQALEKAGFATLVGTTEYDPDRELRWAERALEWRPAALVLTGCDHSEALKARLAVAAIPTLEVWDVTPDPIDICVGIDHRLAGRQLGDYISALGYRAPGYVGNPPGLDPRSDQRVEGISAAFSAVGASPLARVGRSGPNTFEMGASGLAELAGHGYDVVFFQTDHQAFGGLMAAEALGLSVPKDIGIVGFNALGLSKVLNRPLTTIATPRREIGLVGAQRLLARIQGVRVKPVNELTASLIPGATTRQQ